MKPLIGISTCFVDKGECDKRRTRGRMEQSLSILSLDYSESVLAAGGIPVAIPIVENPNYIDEVLDKLDGLVLSGGGDIDPMHYGQSVKKGMGKVEMRRDHFELALFNGAIKRGIPVLGICRGIQLMNVYFGGSLYQDVDTYYETDIVHASSVMSKSDPVHRIDIKKGSLIHELYEKEFIRVNSIHHQIIDRLGDGLEIAAESEDGIIEAIQHTSIPGIFAVQWHPEMMIEKYEEHMVLFKHLIELSIYEA